MANRPRNTTDANDPKRQHKPGSAGADVGKQHQHDPRQSQDPSRRTNESRGDPDRVEIGDPVPEDDRTIRSRRGAGETGEDEDLPGGARRGETGEDEDLPGEARRGETGEDEDLPDDDARH